MTTRQPVALSEDEIAELRGALTKIEDSTGRRGTR